jgi:hypothetical protein
MKYLFSAAEIRVRMEAAGAKLVVIPPAACEKVSAQYESHDSGRGSAESPAYLRMFDQADATYRA